LNEEIEDDKSSRKIDCGQLNKRNNMSMSAFEHLMEKMERQDGEALEV
jgi:hypothetical protein